MDHGDNGGHGGMDMGPKCSMHMLWNTQIQDTCIVFKQWHISSRFIFALSFLAIILISLGYEYIREYQRTVDRHIALALSRSKTRGKGPVSGRSTPEQSGPDVEEAGLLSGSPKIPTWYVPVPVFLLLHYCNVVSSFPSTPVPLYPRILRATLYGVQVFVSFFLMLVFMTYNAYLILAVVIGAGIGHFVFGAEMNVEAILAGGESGKGMACH
ncbi:Ctr copper transporter [Lactarius hatsudake]|nr:Ctr copper transporter [Lactarius hatsudake]